ncbi:MBL fold metallo-hydrolase [Baekduia soli]|uniref:MBL fold metallo-hydrolase n=1 Tax=Baekduia soli TaxID=496014 RepID=A0A5B8TZZ5_9ACTN|nr:MBL fold metallo-hydrolase [Baekduia soli]QEC46307.1 MBL fold metallo-hydrolase [Baekduia soli]
MQVVALHEGVIVARSVKWQTTCTLLHRGEETFVVDSLVYPDELDALPGILGQAGWALSGLLATHADWDHLLARLVFPEASLGVAETTAARLRAEPGRAAGRLRDHDDEDYVQRPRALSLGQVQALPVPGRLELGADAELELVPADGHTADGMAVWAPFARVLCCGDYLSPVEIPMLSPGGDREAYLATLRRLAPYVAQADWVVPGHGAPIDAQRAAAILREDTAYLEALAAGDAPLPIARRGKAMRAIHAENVARAGGGA